MNAASILGACACAAAVAVACASGGGAAPATFADPLAAWDVVYEVLQHPRCANCHPAGDRPLQGDDMRPHAQNVRRGRTGDGVPAMRCATCHREANTPGERMPPGAPHWQLPKPEAPLVFVGMDRATLAAQLKDPARNGGKTPAQVLEHVAHDALVLWGWSPGDGRAPVHVPHDRFVAAMRAWVDAGCPVPPR